MTGFTNSTTSTTSTGDVRIDGLLSETAWSDAILTYAFPSQASDYSGYSWQYGYFDQTLSQAPAGLRAAVARALDADAAGAAGAFSLEGLTGVEVVPGATGTAHLRAAQTDAVLPTASAFYPSTGREGGDAWFGTNAFSDPVTGRYEYATVLHELGHALGLKHAHTGGRRVPDAYDSHEYTVMTYRSYANAQTDAYTNEWDGYPQSFMMLDIAALQHLYGANYATNSGDTLYKWSPSGGQTLIDGAAAIDPGENRVFATIWDGGGTDTYDLSAYDRAVQIDLRPGAYSSLDAGQRAYLGDGNYAAGNVYNALLHQGDARSLIENAIGGAGGDTITGNDAANALTGGGGDDVIDGGAGEDTAVFSHAFAQYAVTVQGGDSLRIAHAGADGTDTVSGVELFRFSDVTLSFAQVAGEGGAPPVLSIADQSAKRGEWRLLTDVLSITEPDGDTVEQYWVRDGSGADSWWADGGYVDASDGYYTTNLSGIWFQGEASAGSQTLQVAARDADGWSATVSFDLATLGNAAPAVSIADQSTAIGEWTLLSDVISVTDADGDSVVAYELWDASGAASWWADAGYVDAAEGYVTYDPGNVWFQGAASAGVQNLYVRSYDGEDWSAWEIFALTTEPAANSAPIVAVADQSTGIGEWTLLSDVISVTDADGDSVVAYELWDASGADSWWADAGYVNAAAGYVTYDPGNVWFQGAASAGTQDLYVRSYDGEDWSAWDIFALTTEAPANTAPVSSIADQTVAIAEWTLLSEVLTITDADGDAAQAIRLWDADGGDNWWADAGVVDASSGYETADIANVWFQGDAAASAQTLWVQAYDGTDWGEWEAFTLTTQAAAAGPVAIIEDLTLVGQGFIALGDVLSFADPEEVVAIELRDDTGLDNFYVFGGPGNVDASDGYVLDDPSITVWIESDLSIDPLAAVLGTQTLAVRGYDGTSWGEWVEFDLTIEADLLGLALAPEAEGGFIL